MELDPVNRSRFGTIVIGAFICLAFEIIFALLAGGIGLSTLRMGGAAAHIGAWAIVYGIITLVLSFFIGGFTAVWIAGDRQPGARFVHGMGVWAVVLVSLAAFAGARAAAQASWIALIAAGIAFLSAIIGALVAQGSRASGF